MTSGHKGEGMSTESTSDGNTYCKHRSNTPAYMPQQCRREGISRCRSEHVLAASRSALEAALVASEATAWQLAMSWPHHA